MLILYVAYGFIMYNCTLIISCYNMASYSQDTCLVIVLYIASKQTMEDKLYDYTVTKYVHC